MKNGKHKKITVLKEKELTDNFISSLKKKIAPTESWSWYDINELNEYLTEAKLAAEKNNKVLSGIRLYLGKYSTEKNGAYTVYLKPTANSMRKSLLSPPDPDMDFDALNFGGTGGE